MMKVPTSIIKKVTTMTKNTQKSVSFAHYAEVLTVESVEDYTHEEIIDTWWTTEDYHSMKCDALFIVNMVRSTKIPIMCHGLVDRMAFRGLEAHIEHERVGKRVDAALDAVLLRVALTSPSKPRSSNEADTSRMTELAETYSLYGQLAMKDAHVQALLDQLAVLVDQSSSDINGSESDADSENKDTAWTANSSSSPLPSSTKRSRRFSGDKSNSKNKKKNSRHVKSQVRQ
jgi:hypothetical protein